MFYHRLKFANVLLIFFIGIALGFLFSKKNYKYSVSDRYKPLYINSEANPVKDIEPQKIEKSNIDQNMIAAEKTKVSNPMDDEDEYVLELTKPEKENKEIYENKKTNIETNDANVRDSEEDFFKDPSSFKLKTVNIKLQMILAKRNEKNWRLNFVYTDENKNLNYLYIDDMDGISGDSPDYRIGYYYRVKFFCAEGALKSGNKLLQIVPTGEKTPWASGVSAVE